MKNNNRNYIFNIVHTILPILCSAIVYPYILRTLEVENMGRIGYCQSILNYFILLANLGIESYAIRVGSKLIEDKNKFNYFYSQIFKIGLVSSLVSFLLYYLIASNDMMSEYRDILMLISINIFVSNMSFDWIAKIKGKFLFLSLMTITLQVIQTVFVFGIVRTQNDVFRYLLLLCFMSLFAVIVKFVLNRRNTKFIVTAKVEIESIKAVLILFFNSVMVTVYVNLDMTMLGFYCGDYSVGIYSFAVTLYTILKSLSSAMIGVKFPIVSKAVNDKDCFKKEIEDLIQKTVLLCSPCVVGILCICKELTLCIGGISYIKSVSVLRVLCVAFIFATIACIMANCVYLPLCREKEVLRVTTISALSNFVLNMILIPKYGYIAAGVTTLISEFVSSLLLFFNGREYVEIRKVSRSMRKPAVGCLCIVVISILCKIMSDDYILRTLLSISISVVIYILINRKELRELLSV
ncbi:MAG: flippase [Lachnospiraceae bacterium]|nr:flippase [Lachnospiraceae bacterium]